MSAHECVNKGGHCMADSRGTEWHVKRGRTRLRCPSRATPRAVLLTSSLMVLDSLPPMPVLALLSALLRVSLAFTSHWDEAQLPAPKSALKQNSI